ncbi:MAG: carboxypeptidase regulatory-like domain-containing protein, partial [Thermoplasmata archaeon]|nr:carboxypeptidase regulatory-like domain-containing protein [Thermoplasmata archaeon]
IAVDSNNRIHISHWGWPTALKYATNASGSWVNSTIDSTGRVGYSTSIAVDSSDGIHISYCDSTNYDLKYATNSSGSWVNSAIDSAGSVGRDTSIAVDSNDRIHISYYDATNTALKYATDASGSWVNSTIDSTNDVGGCTSIAVDSNDGIHISYYDGTNSALKYVMIDPPSVPIPEFSDMVILVVGVTLIVLTAGRIRDRRNGFHREGP